MEIKENKEDLGIDKKIIYFFKKPSVIFNEFIEKPRYLWTMCIITAINVIYAIMQTALSIDIVKRSITGNLPDASKTLVEKFMKYTTSIPVQTVITIVTTVISIYVAALIYKILSRIFGSRIKYKQVVSVYCLSMMPIAIGEVLKWLYMAVTGKPVGVSYLVKPTLLNGVLDKFDIFNIWQIILLTIGISIVGKVSKKKSFAIVAILFALNVFITLHSYIK